MPTQTFFLILAVIFATQTSAMNEELMKKLQKYPEIQRCMESSGYEPDGKGKEERPPEMLCFFKCIMEEKGILDSNGDLHPEAASTEFFPVEEETKQKVIECAAQAGKVESCEDIGKMLDCYIANRPPRT
ncbi:hypothetical protein NQ315_000289 [Exocentrus adspersus]|uniref:Uncharacterized protein n=1 Tax=Exocentrus adspersus TaxID=1586481 RepID=A0AAV8VQY5_9CUCU|nr:hypothetical protein NQ315_000289 [Exocentrus adspersus]